MNQNIPCPICKQFLRVTDNKNMAMCARRKVFVQELDTHLDTVHAMYYFNNDGGIILKVIEVPPYAFEIHTDADRNFFRTRIQRVIDPNKSKKRVRGNKVFQREDLLILPGAVNCQWDDRSQVMDKIKTLLLFS